MSQEPRSNNKVIIPVALALVLGAGGFVGGMQYQKSQGVSATNASAQSTMGGPGGMGGGQSMNGSMGSVTAVSSTSITVKDQRASSSKTYSISDSTTITDNGDTASASDIVVGDIVRVETSSSTSTAATAIMVNPSMGGPGGGQSTGSTTQTQTN